MEISNLVTALAITACIVIIACSIYQLARDVMYRKSLEKHILKGIEEGKIKVHKVETFENDNMVIPEWIKAMSLEEIEKVKEAYERRIHGDN